ncbi:hypothetical protein H9P43_005152 [Blastocladiella emersonii ATCC 22665]|nr:hypothetical protein H9P43_005152 [Blastocladiella emersonii ATCC 22665]
MALRVARPSGGPGGPTSALPGVPDADLFSLSRDEISLLAASAVRRHAAAAAAAVARLHQEVADFEALELEVVAAQVPLPAGSPGPADCFGGDDATVDFDNLTRAAAAADGWHASGAEPSFLLRDESSFHLDLSVADGDATQLSALPADEEEEMESVGPTKLVSAYFPHLAARTASPAPAPRHTASQHHAPPSDADSGVHLPSAATVARAATDETATAAAASALHRERAQLEREKVALDREKLALRTEKKEFESWRLNETAALAEEKRKLKRDRLLLDKQRKLDTAAPNRRERQEIEDLKKQAADLTAQIRAKDTKAKLNEDRLKKRVDELLGQIRELQDELHVLEQERAQAAVDRHSTASSPTFAPPGYGLPSTASSRRSGAGTPPPGVSAALLKRHSTHSASGSALPLSPRMRHLAASPPPVVSVPSAPSVKSVSSSATSNHSGSMHKPRTSPASPAAMRHGSALRARVASSGNNSLTLSAGDNDGKSVLSSMTHAVAAEPVAHWRSYFETVERLSQLGPAITEKTHRDGIRERRYANGTRVVVYKNGTTKEYMMAGTEVTRYTNRDVKEVFADGKLVYYFADKDVTQTTFPDGMTLTEFADGQTEKKYPDGMTEIVFPNQSIRYIYPTGEKEDIFPDGTMEKTSKDGNKTVIHSDGSKEIWTKEKKKRIMPNGEVKVVFADGTRQKILPDGRMRIVDPRGRIIKDEIGADG